MLIGLCGYPLSGKSEVRRILVEQHGFHALDTKVILRQMAATLTGIHADTLATQDGKRIIYNGTTMRDVMGRLGNVAEELWGDSFLVNRAIQDFARYCYPGKRIVVDALRKDQPRDFPGLVYQVVSNRAEEPKSDYDRFYQGNTHGIIVNDGSINDLEQSVKRVFQL